MSADPVASCATKVDADFQDGAEYTKSFYDCSKAGFAGSRLQPAGWQRSRIVRARVTIKLEPTTFDHGPVKTLHLVNLNFGSSIIPIKFKNVSATGQIRFSAFFSCFPAFPDDIEKSLFDVIDFPAPKLREIGLQVLELTS